MSIKPIDMHIMLNNTANVNKVNNSTQQHGENQLVFEHQLKQNVERDSSRTIETNKSEDQRIKDDNRGNKGQYKQNKNKKENENENLIDDVEPVKKNKSTSIFDVSI